MSEQDKSIDPGSFSRLVIEARHGDGLARSEICRQVREYLCGRVDRDLDQRLRAKLNPSDIAQQAMLRMVEGLEDFRGSSSREFYAWLNSILRNEILSIRRDYYRQRRDVRREEGPAAGETFDLTANEPSVEATIRQREQLAQFREVIERLPEDYARVVRLRGIEELPFAEIAVQMERSVDSVSKLWSRALIRLAEELKKKNESIS